MWKEETLPQKPVVTVTFVKHHAEHGPPVFFEFGEKFKRTEKLAEIFQKLQKKYWEPICDRFTAWPLILGRDYYIVEITDLFEMDSVVFRPPFINGRPQDSDSVFWKKRD